MCCAMHMPCWVLHGFKASVGAPLCHLQIQQQCMQVSLSFETLLTHTQEQNESHRPLHTSTFDI